MMQKIILWSTCKFMSLYFQTVRVQCIINNHIFSWKPRLFLIPVIRSFIGKFCCLVCFSMHNGHFELISIVWLLLIIIIMYWWLILYRVIHYQLRRNTELWHWHTSYWRKYAVPTPMALISMTKLWEQVESMHSF